MTQSTIPISLSELLALSHGDDTQFHNRCWLGIYTMAHGYCRVINKSLAENIFALDRAEQIAHIEVYDTRASSHQPLYDRFPETYKPAAVSAHIYTLWQAQTWLESNERVRLTRAKCAVLHAAVTARDICEHIARAAAAQIAGRNTEHNKLVVTGLLAQAASLNYETGAFLMYLDLLAKNAGLVDINTNLPLDLTSKHRSEFLTTNNNEESRASVTGQLI